jgi:hypothetical protein
MDNKEFLTIIGKYLAEERAEELEVLHLELGNEITIVKVEPWAPNNTEVKITLTTEEELEQKPTSG